MMLSPANQSIDLSKAGSPDLSPSFYHACLRLISRLELVFAAVALSEGGDVKGANELLSVSER